jgi:hypothetical protein
MLTLRDIILTKTTSTRRTASDLVFNRKESKFTVSEKFFEKADLQNNYLAVFIKDSAIYLLVHHNETYQVDFFRGKRKPLLDAEGKEQFDADGKKILSDEIGKKSRTFKDKVVAGEATIEYHIGELFKDTINEETIRFDCIELPMIEGATDCHALYSVVLENSTTNTSEDNEEDDDNEDEVLGSIMQEQKENGEEFIPFEEFSNALTEE